MNKNNLVKISACAEYDENLVNNILRSHFNALGFTPDIINGKRVVIKPNLVSPFPPERAVTTHPALIYAAAKIIAEYGGTVIIAESPAGLYTESALKSIYRITGAEDAARRSSAVLNYDVSYRHMHSPDGHLSKLFDVISPILDCDIIINIAKLKTHTLTGISAAAKNLFGVVPGLLKPEQHARFNDQADFMRAICDLADAVSSSKPSLHIIDGVVAMEGNGPSGGPPRQVGAILSSCNPFNCDLAAAKIIGQTNALMLKTAAEWNLCPSSCEELEIDGDEIAEIKDYLAPDSDLKKWFDYIPKFLRPHPIINVDKCKACGKCAEVCPAKTIKIAEIDGKKRAVIDKTACIRCFCCQELCPFQAVDVKKFWLFNLIR